MGTTGARVVKRAGLALFAAAVTWAHPTTLVWAAGGAIEPQPGDSSPLENASNTKLSKGAPTQRVNLMVQDRGVSSPEPGKNEALDKSYIGLGAGFFIEDSEQRDEFFVGGQEPRNQEPREWESASVYNIQAWYLRTIFTPGLRWGAGLTWYNSYSLEEPDSDDDDDAFVVGQLFQVGLQAEYEIERIVSDLGIVVGLRGGGSLLFPSKDLREQIEGLERRGFDVWGGPSPGVYVAPLAGVRWPLTQRIALRADISAQFSKLWLYSADGEAAGITSEANSELGTTRTQLLVGLDFGL